MIKALNQISYLCSWLIMGLMIMQSNVSQAQGWGDGEIESVEIEIVKDREVTVPKASRMFSKVPPRPYEPITPPITYQFRNIAFRAPDLNPAIRPLRLKQEELSKIYGAHVKLGYGNFASPLLEARINNKRDKQKHYGVNFKHHSFGKGPVQDELSAAGQTAFDAYGRLFGAHANVGGQISFDNRFTHFYGYPENFDFTVADIDRTDIRQSFNRFGIKADLANTGVTKYNYRLGSGFTYLTDNYNATESEVALDLQSHYKFNDDYRLSIDADYFVISRKDELVEAKPRHLFILKPSFKFTLLEKFRISAGFNLAMDNDTLGIEKTARIYPDVNVRYDLSPSVEVFAGITGNMERVSLQTLTNQNLWIDANVPIYHSNKLLEFFGGINGRLGRRAGYELGVSASNYRNLYFFLNQDATPVKFDVVYDDGSAGVFKLHAAFNFTHSDRFNVSTRAAYTSYILDAIETPWHRPGFEFNTRMRYNIYDKVVLKAETFVMSGLRSLDYSTNEAITLSPAVDVNAGLDYLVSKKFNVFVQGTNLLNRTYPLFYQYPVRGMQIMAGFGYSF